MVDRSERLRNRGRVRGADVSEISLLTSEMCTCVAPLDHARSRNARPAMAFLPWSLRAVRTRSGNAERAAVVAHMPFHERATRWAGSIVRELSWRTTNSCGGGMHGRVGQHWLRSSRHAGATDRRTDPCLWVPSRATRWADTVLRQLSAGASRHTVSRQFRQ